MIRGNLLLIIILIFSFSIQAQEWEQLGNDIDGENGNELFGASVNVSADGKTVAIGDPYSSKNGKKYSGEACVYEFQNNKWIKRGISIFGESKGDQCGSSLSLNSDGNILAVSFKKFDGNGKNSGCVRIYKNNNNNWIQLGQDILGDNRNERFGFSSLSSDGYTIAIGSSYNDTNGNYSGQVKVYKYSNGKWVQLGNFINGKSIEDYFGYSLDLNSNGSVIVIGASERSWEGTNPGRVEVYEFKNNRWNKIGKDIKGEMPGDMEGIVSINSDGSIIATSARSNDENGKNSGHARVFKNINGVWVQLGENIVGEAPKDEFGSDISLSSDGKIIAISSRWNDGNGQTSGYTRVFEFSGNNWKQIGEDIKGENEFDQSGMSISMSIDGKIIAIGAHAATNVDGVTTGHVRVFKLKN